MFLVASVVVAAAVVQVPYYLLAPGSTYPTGEHITIEGAPTYDHGDDIAFTTVSLRRATALQAVVGWFDPTVDVRPEREVLGDRTQEQNRELNLREMADSKQVATAVALEELGYEVTPVGTGAVVARVEDPGPSAGHLERGDVIVDADGTPITVHGQLIDVIGAHQPGEQIVLGVEPLDGGERRTVTITLGARPDDATRPMLGVSLGTRDLSFQFPFLVEIDSGSVGGPSAGLALTLGVMDALTPESLTGGLRVVTTGTIQLSGAVGPVGGVEQKTVAVRRSGADLFLVPSSELEEARRYAGEMRVEAVDTLDQALEVLSTVGGGTQALAAAPPAGGG